MATEPIKLTDTEISSIQEIQSKYNQKISDIGKTEINIMNLEAAVATAQQQVQKLQGDQQGFMNAKIALKAEVATMQQDEQVFLKTLSANYGNGTLDISNMTFTPNS